MQRVSKLCLLVSLLGAVAMAGAHEVHAEWRQVHGTACKPSGNFNSTVWSDFAYFDGSLRNISTVNTRFAVCPITHDYFNFDNSNVRVHVYDGSTTEQLACYAFARNSMGSGYITGYQYSSAASGGPSSNVSYTGFSTITWSSPFGGAYDFNSMSMSCSVPKRGSVYSDIIGVGAFSTSP